MPAAPTRRRPSRLLGLVTLATAVAALAGCGAVGDQVDQLSEDVRTRAASELDRAVQDQVDRALEQFGGSVDVDRLCELVADDRLTAGERGRLEVAVEVGEALGLPESVTSAGRQVLDTTDGATDRVGDLATACAEAGADPTGS